MRNRPERMPSVKRTLKHQTLVHCGGLTPFTSFPFPGSGFREIGRTREHAAKDPDSPPRSGGREPVILYLILRGRRQKTKRIVCSRLHSRDRRSVAATAPRPLTADTCGGDGLLPRWPVPTRPAAGR